MKEQDNVLSVLRTLDPMMTSLKDALYHRTVWMPIAVSRHHSALLSMVSVRPVTRFPRMLSGMRAMSTAINPCALMGRVMDAPRTPIVIFIQTRDVFAAKTDV